jgi:hypothetical protein
MRQTCSSLIECYVMVVVPVSGLAFFPSAAVFICLVSWGCLGSFAFLVDSSVCFLRPCRFLMCCSLPRAIIEQDITHTPVEPIQPSCLFLPMKPKRGMMHQTHYAVYWEFYLGGVSRHMCLIGGSVNCVMRHSITCSPLLLQSGNDLRMPKAHKKHVLVMAQWSRCVAGQVLCQCFPMFHGSIMHTPTLSWLYLGATLTWLVLASQILPSNW